MPVVLSKNAKSFIPNDYIDPLYSQGLVSDIEFLNFENEGEFKKYRL